MISYEYYIKDIKSPQLVDNINQTKQNPNRKNICKSTYEPENDIVINKKTLPARSSVLTPLDFCVQGNLTYPPTFVHILRLINNAYVIDILHVESR